MTENIQENLPARVGRFPYTSIGGPFYRNVNSVGDVVMILQISLIASCEKTAVTRSQRVPPGSCGSSYTQHKPPPSAGILEPSSRSTRGPRGGVRSP